MGPLVVDLDGTLVNSDLLVESAIAFAGQRPLSSSLRFFAWYMRGRAVLKKQLAEAINFDVRTLPYNAAVLERIQAAKNMGQKVYLASASDARPVSAVADYLGCFDGWFASDGHTNLSKKAKADRLVADFGPESFDYIGNSRDDLPVWRMAAKSILVNASPSLVRAVQRLGRPYEILPSQKVRLGNLVKLLRPHQCVKNALVFIPLLAAHLFSGSVFIPVLLAFVAFSLCASSVYIINDLVDVQADRRHPTKKNRPIAAGTVSLLASVTAVPFLLAAAFFAAWLVSLQFVAVLAGYLAITTAYTFSLKRKLLIDAITLAATYTIRVIGGAVAAGVVASQWLLAFSMFLFLSLTLVKRYSEMALRLDAALPDPANRNYRTSDLSVIASLAAASGYSAVVVYSLYLSSDAVKALYHHPNLLWLTCPVLLFWVSRMLMLSHRRVLQDDPVLFAIKDRASLVCAGLIGLFTMMGA